MKTVRIFEKDSYKKDFKASIVKSLDVEGKQGVILDQTIFYPASGGQPADRGFLGSVSVIDVFEDGEVIVHVLDGIIGDKKFVKGEIDWNRRLDHMQQHTGQHILSQSFFQSHKAETVGFHLGKEISTIDLNKAELSVKEMQKVEFLANEIIFENREIIIKEIGPESINNIPFRKRPEDKGIIRVVEVEEFDWSGCCGTHLKRTGETGLIKVIRWEHYKGGTRVAFLCGYRALKDYQQKTVILRDICRTLTVGEDDIVTKIAQWHEERKSTNRRIRSLLNNVLEYEANNLWERAYKIGPYRIVKVIFEGRDQEEVSILVKKLSMLEGVVILVGIKRERGYLYFGRSSAVEIDVRILMEEACKEIDGRGGGSSDMAQGSGRDITQLTAAMDKAENLLHEQIIQI